MNSLYGRLGLNPLRTTMCFEQLKNGKLRDKHLYSNGTISLYKLDKNNILSESWTYCDTNLLTVSYAAAVTSYTRIEMHKALMKAWKLNWKVLYMDTDSIFVSHPGREKVEKEFPISKACGEWGYEGGPYTKSQIIGLKCYRHTAVDGNDKLAFKGLPRKYLHTLTDNDFTTIQNGECVERTILSSRSGKNTLFHERDLGKIYRTIKPFKVRAPPYTKGIIIPDSTHKAVSYTHLTLPTIYSV